jgi:uncharacterized repeat protein (TIGR02543 family)
LYNPVQIIFDGNGATSGKMEHQSFFVGENKILNENRYIKEGYIFSGWTLNSNDAVVYEDESNFTMIPIDTETIVFHAQWTPRTDIPYLVNHYLQNAYDEEYTLNQSFSLIGVADSVIAPAVNQYDGFSSPNVKTVTIAVDGSLIVDYYYSRNSYTLTFIANGGTSSSKT